jgi:hypothetical protein
VLSVLPFEALFCDVGVSLCSAPELPLYNDGKYEFSIDIWAAGCVMAEMLGMTSSGLERRNRLPLFPGTSCLPLSRGTSIGIVYLVFLAWGPVSRGLKVVVLPCRRIRSHPQANQEGPIERDFRCDRNAEGRPD